MMNSTKRRVYRYTLLRLTAKAVVAQWPVFLASMLFVLPCNVFFCYFYSEFSKILRFQVHYSAFQENLLGIFVLLLFWFFFPVFWVISYVWTIILVKRYAYGIHDSINVGKAFSDSLRVLPTMWQFIAVFWLFAFFLLQVDRLLTFKETFSFLNPFNVKVFSWAAFLILMLFYTNAHSFCLQAYILHKGTFREALQKSRLFTSLNFWGKILGQLFCLALFFSVPTLLYVYSVREGISFDYFLTDYFLLRILVVSLMHLFFLFITVTRTLMFARMSF